MSSPENMQAFVARSKARYAEKQKQPDAAPKDRNPFMGIWDVTMHVEAGAMATIANMRISNQDPLMPNFTEQKITQIEANMRAEVAELRKWMKTIGPDARYGEFLALKNGLPRNHFFEGLE
ncbi:MAG: hypothetical protein KA035_01185 [Candidatus Levybacteria bacterium]|nr:hypothetical protein [Candidatus Levybacteria bacterium]